MKNKVLQIAWDNDSALMEGKFSYRAEKILHKPILFDTSRVDEESIMDKIIENLLSTNDEFYMIHELGANSWNNLIFFTAQRWKIRKKRYKRQKTYLKN